MKLLARFNLIFLVVFGLGLTVTVWMANVFLRNDAKARVLTQAQLVMATTLATRTYTANQINPLLTKQQRRDSKFLPQTVPAYSAIEVFNYLHQQNPAYAIRKPR
jgi:Protein of unknown function (DUF3365)